jgi:hypothetical protein
MSPHTYRLVWILKYIWRCSKSLASPNHPNHETILGLKPMVTWLCPILGNLMYIYIYPLHSIYFIQVHAQTIYINNSHIYISLLFLQLWLLQLLLALLLSFVYVLYYITCILFLHRERSDILSIALFSYVFFTVSEAQPLATAKQPLWFLSMICWLFNDYPPSDPLKMKGASWLILFIYRRMHKYTRILN